MFSNTYFFVTAWFLLHVYVLVDVLDFIIVLYHSRVFKYMLVYSGGGLCISAKRIYVRRENCFNGLYHIRLYKLWVGSLLFFYGTYWLRARSSHAVLFIKLCTAVKWVAPS